MARKKKIAKTIDGYASRAASSMKFKELQRANVARGLEFEDAVNFDFHQHQSWFIKNEHLGQNLANLDDFDNWMTEQLVKAGYSPNDPLNHPSLRLGYVPVEDENGETKKTKKIKGPGIRKEKKPKAERVEGTNLLAGTKKALTYELALKGDSLPTIIEQVKERFPDANESSIRNWMKRALKGK